MKRSNNREKSQQLNRAFGLLTNGYSTNLAAEILVAQFGFSLRQAYRYLREAEKIVEPVPFPEPMIPMTIKISRDIAMKLRACAKTNNITIGEIIRHAVLSFLASKDYYG